MRVITSFDDKEVRVQLDMNSEEAKRLIDTLTVEPHLPPMSDDKIENYTRGLTYFIGIKNFLP